MLKAKNIHAVILGRLGGRKRSTTKTKAARRNATIATYLRQQRRAARLKDSA